MGNDNQVPTLTPKTQLIQILENLGDRLQKLEKNALAQQEVLSDLIAKHNGLIRGHVVLREEFEKLLQALKPRGEDRGEGFLN